MALFHPLFAVSIYNMKDNKSIRNKKFPGIDSLI